MTIRTTFLRPRIYHIILLNILAPCATFAIILGSDKASLDMLTNKKGELSFAERYLLALIDPTGSEFSSLGISIGYDPSKFKVRADLSGPVGLFAQGGSDTPGFTGYGSFLLSDKPVVDFIPGSPLPGSSLVITDNAVTGIVTIDYILNTPLVLPPLDHNWFGLVFEAYVPFNPFQTVVTSHSQPGTYDFTQLSNYGGGSDTPVSGITFQTVPDSPNPAILLVGSLLIIGVLRIKQSSGKMSARR